MSETLPKSVVYRIQLEHVCSWADCIWTYKIYDANDDRTVLWQGDTSFRWSALWDAKRAVKKLRKGRTFGDRVRPNPESIYIYP